MFRVKSNFLKLDTLQAYELDDQVEIVTGKNGKTYIYKSINMGSRESSIANAETIAAFGYLYQIILGPERTSDTIALVDETRVGILSEFIPGFEDRSSNEDIPIKDIKGFACLLVASFFLGERDLSDRNYGYTANRLLCKIDHDLSGTDSLNLVEEFKDDFIIDAERIAKFPDMPKIHNWPRKDIADLMKTDEKAFREELFKSFLFLSCISEKSIELIGDQFFSDKEIGKIFVSHYVSKIRALKDIFKEAEFVIKQSAYKEYILNQYKTTDFKAEDKSSEKYIINLKSGGQVVSGEDPLEDFEDLRPQDENELYTKLGYTYRLFHLAKDDKTTFSSLDFKPGGGV